MSEAIFVFFNIAQQYTGTLITNRILEKICFNNRDLYGFIHIRCNHFEKWYFLVQIPTEDQVLETTHFLPKILILEKDLLESNAQMIHTKTYQH